MAESDHVDQPKKGKKSRKVGYLKLKVIEDLKVYTIDTVVEECISKLAHVKSDDSTSYVGLSKKVEQHISKQILNKDINKELPWVHIAISNAKSWLLSNFHKINKEYLQYYLDKFCYNFNRRYLIDNLFD